MRIFSRTLRDERGDIIVTPAIMLLLGVTVLLLGGASYLASKAVGSKVSNTNQGLKIDENGNVVEGAVGVIPVPKATETPEPQTKVIEETVHQTGEPAAEPQVVVATMNPGDNGNVSQGTSSSSNSSDDSHPTEEPMETHHEGCCGP